MVSEFVMCRGKFMVSNKGKIGQIIYMHSHCNACQP